MPKYLVQFCILVDHDSDQAAADFAASAMQLPAGVGWGAVVIRQAEHWWTPRFGQRVMTAFNRAVATPSEINTRVQRT